MTGRDAILKLAALYGSALKIERTTVSWRLFQDTNKLDAIAGGSDLFLGRYERALQFFSDHWPTDVKWPLGVARPEPRSITLVPSNKPAGAHA